jgi:hypothetical protein
MFNSADKLSAPPINDPTVEGVQLLFFRVICQAVEDHATPTGRHEVEAFFSGSAFARYCALLGWNHDWARRQLRRSVVRGPLARWQARSPSTVIQTLTSR